ncbi:MAG: amidophosphoribosyltransferase, partial [Candidatus Bathyarchaeia archaeon]
RMGLVFQDYDETYKEIGRLEGSIGIGHVRYSTTAQSTLENAHPLEIGPYNRFFISHNGTLDREPLMAYLKEEGLSPSRSMTDTELMGLGLHQLLKDGKDWFEAFELLNSRLTGSFSLVILPSGGDLIGARDDRGFRPLCLGWQKDTSSYVIASESYTLDCLRAELIRDIQPGEMVKIGENGLETYQFSKKERHAHCPFEYTYFAHPSSIIEGINVYYARKRIGRELARKYPIDGDVVIPVPDSARPSALGYAEASGIPFEEGLMKDRYRRKGSLRSFIEPEKREEVVFNINPIKDAITGKKVILIDDSIVRGTSSKILVKDKLKSAEAVSLLIDFPPILHPCYMGIDFPTREELLAYRVCKTTQSLEEINEKVGKEIGVNFLGYNDVDGLSRGIGLPKEELCLACTTGDYSCLNYKPLFKTREEMKS